MDYLFHYVVKEDTGLCAQFSYFMHALSCCLNCDEKLQINTTEMIKVNDIGNFEFMRCISLELEACYKYYILKNNKTFAVSRQRILNYIDDNYGIHNCYDILEMGYPLKFKVTKNILKRLTRYHFLMNNPLKNNKHNIR